MMANALQRRGGHSVEGINVAAAWLREEWRGYTACARQQLILFQGSSLRRFACVLVSCLGLDGWLKEQFGGSWSLKLEAAQVRRNLTWRPARGTSRALRSFQMSHCIHLNWAWWHQWTGAC